MEKINKLKHEFKYEMKGNNYIIGFGSGGWGVGDKKKRTQLIQVGERSVCQRAGETNTHTRTHTQ